jgi:hypothetical protein
VIQCGPHMSLGPDPTKHCRCLSERTVILRINVKGEVREVCKQCQKPLYVEPQITFAIEKVPA